VVYLNGDERLVHPVAGWLVQESYQWDVARQQAQDDDQPDRRVIPGVCVAADGWIVEPIDVDEPLVWTVLAPGEPDPTGAEQLAEQARREEARRQRHS
jgi:hypothetical protein